MALTRALALAGTVAALCLGGSVARADTYCVTPASGCDGAHTFGTVQPALDAASGDGVADTVELGAATYSQNGLIYAGSDPVSIVGAGTGATTLRRATPASGSAVLTGGAFSTVSVSHLHVHLLFLASASVPGLELGIGTVDDVLVDGDAGSYHPSGISISGGGAIAHTTVQLTAGGDCIDASGTAPVTFSDDILRGCSIGLNSQGGTNHAERIKVIDANTGVDAGGGSNLTIEDSVILFSSGSTALEVAASGSATSLTADHITLVGAGGGTGVEAFNHATTSASLTLRHSIVRGFGTSLQRDATSGHTANLVADYNDYDVASVSQTGPGTLTSTHVYNNVDPLFVNAAAGDYHLLASSPLIDQDPTPLAVGESPFDFDGNVRIVNGARDLGAFEHVLAPVATTGAASAITGTGATVAGVVNPGGAHTSWQIVYGTTPGATGTAAATLDASVSDQPVSVQLTGLTPGTTYHYAVTATNSAGSQTGADRTFTTASAAVTAKPALSRLRLSPRSFAAARSGASLSARAGARLSYRLSSAATVSFRVRRLLPGVRSGKRCVSRHKARKKRGRRCTRAKLVKGSFKRASAAGANSARFRGRVGGHTLHRGRYRLTGKPSAAGGKGGAVSVKFRIVGRAKRGPK